MAVDLAQAVGMVDRNGGENDDVQIDIFPAWIQQPLLQDGVRLHAAAPGLTAISTGRASTLKSQ